MPENQSSKPVESPGAISLAGRFLPAAMEACLLIMAVAVPLHFNVLSQHIFENHKYALFRAGAFVLAGLWFVYAVDQGRRPRPGLLMGKNMWRPLLAFLASLAVSCLFSIGPYLSFWGEIFRHVGLLTQLSCILVFAVILRFFKSHEQVERMVTVLVMSSLPISLYALAQHYGPDPMPWKGNVGARCVSTLGNAVFLGAFEIMVFFPTLARVFSSLVSKRPTGATPWKASFYAALAALQLLAAWHSGSRGPILAFMAGMVVFLILMGRGMVRGQWRTLGAGLVQAAASLAAGLGMGMTAAILNQYWMDAQSAFLPIYFAWPILALAGICVLALAGPKQNKGRLLAAAWSLIVALLVVIAASGITFVHVRPEARETGTQEEKPEKDAWTAVRRTGSVETRVYIWEGYIDVFFSNTPLLKILSAEDGATRENRFGYLRPLVGFGQETVGTAFRQRYPLGLLKKLPPSETADRAHNDLLTRLTSTGILGLAAYLWLVWAILARGLSAMGYPMLRPNRRALALFFWGGIVLGVLFFLGVGYWGKSLAELVAGHSLEGRLWRLMNSGAAFVGVGAHVGLVGGVAAYCLLGKKRTRHPSASSNITLWTSAGLFCALISNITETTVSFPFSSTTLCFWIFSGLLAVIASRRLSSRKPAQVSAAAPMTTPAPKGKGAKAKAHPKEVQAAPQPHPKPWGLVALAMLLGVIVALTAFDFLGHQWSVVHMSAQGPVLKMPEIDAVPGMGILRAGNAGPGEYNQQRTMVFMVLLFLPWLAFSLFAVLETRDASRPTPWGIWQPLVAAAGMAAAASALVVISLFAWSLLSSQVALGGEVGGVIEGVVRQSRKVASRIGVQYLWMLAAALGVGAVLMQSSGTTVEIAPRKKTPLRTYIALAAASLLVFPAVALVTVRPVAADVLAARAKQWTQGMANPNIGTRIDGRQFLHMLSAAHSLEATRQAPFISAHHTDLAADASVLAQVLSKKEPYFTDAPDLKALERLKLSDLERFDPEDARILSRLALESCFDINPSDAQNPMNLARLYAQWGSPMGAPPNREKQDLADKWYEIARTMTPHNAHFETEIGKFHFVNRRDPKRALEHLERSLVADDGHLETYLVMADVRMSMLGVKCRRALQSAMSLKSREIEPSPDCQASLDEVAALMEKALEVKPDSAESLIKLAGVFINARKPDKAVQALEKGFAVQPRNAAFMKQLVFICKKEDNPQLGLDLFSRLIDNKPRKAEIRLSAAEFLLQVGMKDQVPEHLEAALGLEPQNAGVCRTAAEFWTLSGRLDKARECAKKATVLQPRKPQNWLMAAAVYEQLKEYKNAAEALERAARTSRDSAQIVPFLNKAAQFWKMAGDPGKAREAERRAKAFSG